MHVGDSVLVGPHTHLNGTTVEDEVFVATGVSIPGSVAGTGSELRINSVLHVNSRLEPGTTCRSVVRASRHLDAGDHAAAERGVRRPPEVVAVHDVRGLSAAVESA